MYIPAVQGLYAIGSVLNALAAITSMAFLGRLSAQPHNKQISAWLIAFLTFTTSALSCALCCVRAAWPENGAGSAVAPTVLLSMWTKSG